MDYYFYYQNRPGAWRDNAGRNANFGNRGNNRGNNARFGNKDRKSPPKTKGKNDKSPLKAKVAAKPSDKTKKDDNVDLSLDESR